MADPRSSLVSLLSSTSYRLAYALPLLLLSVLVTFTGTFLTLDRSRSFPPRYDVLPGLRTKSKFRFLLEGGIGGLAVGYLFGLHFSTFLSLLIPSLSSTSAPLSPPAFLAIWILSSALCCPLAGRYRLVAIGFSGLVGGATFPLALSVILHPALSTRTIVVAIFLPILFLLSVLPIAQTQRPALRLANASTGAFGLVLAISILANIPAWANVWDRLWVKDDIEWGTAKERYLSAAYCLFLTFGMVSDWLLRSKFGECPDEKWDTYLASYTNNLPSQADRAGTFQPAEPFWDRLLHPKPKATELLFPETGAAHRPTSLGYQNLDVDLDLKMPPPAPGFLKKQKAKSRGFRKSSGGSNSGRKPIKFKPLDADLSDDSSDEAPDVKRPWAHKSASSSTAPTLVNSTTPGADKSKTTLAPPKLREDQPDYSDFEEDLTTQHKRGDHNDQGKWTPAFIRKHTASTAQTRSHTASTVATAPAPGAIPVPATPSLIKALDRIAVAQKDAFSHTDVHQEGTRASKHDGLPRVHDSPLSDDDSDADPEAGDLTKPQKGKKAGGRHWDEFWRDVKDKAQR